MANLTRDEIIEAVQTAITSNTPFSGSCSDNEILDTQNAIIEVLYSINPSTKPTPKIKF